MTLVTYRPYLALDRYFNQTYTFHSGIGDQLIIELEAVSDDSSTFSGSCYYDNVYLYGQGSASMQSTMLSTTMETATISPVSLPFGIIIHINITFESITSNNTDIDKEVLQIIESTIESYIHNITSSIYSIQSPTILTSVTQVTLAAEIIVKSEEKLFIDHSELERLLRDELEGEIEIIVISVSSSDIGGESENENGKGDPSDPMIIFVILGSVIGTLLVLIVILVLFIYWKYLRAKTKIKGPSPVLSTSQSDISRIVEARTSEDVEHLQQKADVQKTDRDDEVVNATPLGTEEGDTQPMLHEDDEDMYNTGNGFGNATPTNDVETPTKM